MDTAALANERYVSITTFRRDDTPVSTPVWVAGENGSLLVWSAANSWKVKRIRRDQHVRIARCTVRGEARGEAVDADATVIDDTSRVSELLVRKYGLSYRAVRLFNAAAQRIRRRSPPRSVTIRITPR